MSIVAASLDLHPYETLTLSTAGYVLGILLFVVHLGALLLPEQTKQFLKRAPRNVVLGEVVLGVAMLWFFLLMMPKGEGLLHALSTPLPGFEGIRTYLLLAAPLFFILMVVYVKEFLFVRALGVFLLLFVCPFLSAAFLKNPETRLLIPIWAYVVIVMSLFWIGKPYLMRDQINALLARPKLWAPLCWGGMFYGLAIIVCDALYW